MALGKFSRRKSHRALPAVVDQLESRRLMAFALHVNFEPAGAAVPAGYVADTGATFGDRGNAFSYGWNSSISTGARDRNNSLSADQRYDTLIHTQLFGERTWEAAVPNGMYNVHLAAGDPSYIDSIYKFNVEGVLGVSGTPSSGARWVEGSVAVNVTDGRLTISNATGASNNKIDFVDIASADLPPPTEAHINFQPAGAPIPAGYLVDAGAVFGNRGNGFSYGFSADNSANTRDRNSSISPDQRFDTLNHFRASKWEIGLPNGTYHVHLVAGDPSFVDSVYKIDAEGVRLIDGNLTALGRWIEGAAYVTVSDGRLTLTNAQGSANNKLCFIDIKPAMDVPPTVSITAPNPDASEAGPTGQSFLISRSGSISTPLLVNVAISGTATNGTDYSTIDKFISIPAGFSSVTVPVSPVDDSVVEGSESVTLTLAASITYTGGGATAAATINIADNDVATGTAIAWTTRAAAQIVRSEAMVANIDNSKMYVFGGYVDTHFLPTGRVDVYDAANNIWAAVNTTMPSPSTHTGTAVVAHDVYLAGGYVNGGGFQVFATTKVWKFNVDALTWTALPGLPSARGGGALVALDGRLHFFGGSDINRVDRGDHWVLDLSNLGAGWVSKAALPTLRNHLGGVALDGKIYAVGGQQNQDASEVPQGVVEVYDPVGDTWSAAASLPFGRSHIAAATVVVNGRIIVLGGETTFNTSVNNVSAYDPGNNSWTEMTVLPVKRSSGVAALLAGDLYYSGGLLTNTTFKGVLS